MKIRIALNSTVDEAANIRTQLNDELHGLEKKDLEISTQTKEVEIGTLGPVEVYEFVVTYGKVLADVAPLVSGILELSKAVLDRYGLKHKKRKKGQTKKVAQPTAIIIEVDGRTIHLPADNAKLKKFAVSLGKAQPRRARRKNANARPSKSISQRKRRRGT
jgi:hypothetical protein